MQAVIKITLKSDICIGSGYSYAGIVDSDTCYDDCGLPYIPARRIKGCLREAAGLIGTDKETIRKIFGGRGQGYNDMTLVSFFDGKLNKADKIAPMLRARMFSEGEDRITREEILDQFTERRAQTKIGDNGVADDQSLRFTRVVRHYNPIDLEELIFEAPVEIESDDENVFFELTRIVKALRHMGMNRNRGLGNVSCRLEKLSDGAQAGVTIEDNSKAKGQVVLSYTIRTDGPVMISKSSDRDTETYIDGQTVLGYFASQYLKNYSAESKSFENTFLRNGVRFSPLYPTDKAGRIYYPAPAYIGRLKKSRCFVNQIAQYDGSDYNYRIDNGNQPKKLTGKYLALKDKNVYLKEVETEIVYHNRHKTDESDRQLYVSQAIKAGQYYKGTITGNYEAVCELANILGDNTITFGKSRKAQYGRCSLVEAGIKDYDTNTEKYQKGDRVIAVLRSDALIMGDAGYTVRADEVRSAIEEQLGIPATNRKCYTELEVKELTGYYSVWNLKRQALPGVTAGGTFEFELAEDAELPAHAFIGEKNGEGLGMVSLCRLPEDWEIAGEPAEEQLFTKEAEDERRIIEPIIKAVYMERARRSLLNDIIERIKSENSKVMSASLVGRLNLMLSESISENSGDICNTGKSLKARIESIKAGGTCDKDRGRYAEQFRTAYYDKLLNEDVVKQLERLGATAEEIEKIRIEGFRQAITLLKYMQKGGSR